MNAKDTTIQVRCSNYQKTAIVDFCSKYGITVSDFILKLCMRFTYGVSSEISEHNEDYFIHRLVVGSEDIYHDSFNLIFKNILDSLNI